MTKKWNLTEAKKRLTEVVNLALSEVPQVITRRNDTVVVISAEKYAEFSGQPYSFKDFLVSGPSLEGLDLERDKSPMRVVGGQWKGRVKMGEDFDSLPVDIAEAFGREEPK